MKQTCFDDDDAIAGVQALMARRENTRQTRLPGMNTEYSQCMAHATSDDETHVYSVVDVTLDMRMHVVGTFPVLHFLAMQQKERRRRRQQ